VACSSRSAVGTGRSLPATKTCPFVVVEFIYGLDCGPRGGGGSRNWWAGGEFGA
jgi:hypothetical protein